MTRHDDATRPRHIPWRGAIALRNRLIHGYDAMDMDILWAIVRDDLPPLIAELRCVLGEEPSPP
jgi:uncharacterized protein with HEPN domain